jgi:hypothetical protein
MGLIDGKNRGSKISCHAPFKNAMMTFETTAKNRRNIEYFFCSDGAFMYSMSHIVDNLLIFKHRVYIFCEKSWKYDLYQFYILLSRVKI